MSRQVFSGEAHDTIADKYEGFHADVINEVATAVKSDDFVIVGMAQNPFCKRARKAAQATGKTFKYLEYGSYLNTWKPRLAIKMWSGWPTFPIVFVKGQLVGGAQDLEKLIADGKLDELLA
jgi:monothiol glutaredoxin